MKLYFMRHGESEANVLHEVSNRGHKHGLTLLGRSQAEQLASTLSEIAPSRIFSSPLLRTVQTAEILSAYLSIPFQVTDALREYDCGIIEGRSDAEAWRIWSAGIQACLRGDWQYRIPEGESLLDIRKRFEPFINLLISTYGATDERIVLVGHGGVYRCMFPLVLSNVDAQFSLTHNIKNTGIIIAESRGDALVCLDWCGTTM
jgi:broad specificity phosphatase PhoE